MRPIDADALKICLQNHYDVIEQDFSISEKFADGAVSGINAAMFEIDTASTIDAIPVEWLKEHEDEDIRDTDGNSYGRRKITVVEALSMWQKEQEASST